MSIKRISIASLMLVFFLFPLQLYSQVITGKVKEKETNTALEGISITLHKHKSVKVIAFTFTDADGSYILEFQELPDSLEITVSGFNIESQTKVVNTKDLRMDFSVNYANQEIREAKVRAESIVRKRDTLVYYVEQFRSDADKSIGDVIRRLPGVQVEDNGQIKYNGKSINMFYIEGLDMLGGKYGIATANVQAQDIAAVEVYENHQPIKMLEDWVESDRAALNLRLKEGAKGSWNAVIESGLGYKPLLWNLALTPMFFSRKFQSIFTFKANNNGEDVARELKSYGGSLSDVTRMTGVLGPSNPPLSERYYLNNNIQAASANAILKTGEYSDIRTQVHFIHDTQQRESSSNTIYYIPGQSPVSIAEQAISELGKNEVRANIQYRLNNSSIYFRNEATILTEAPIEQADSYCNNNNVNERFRLNRVGVADDIAAMKRFGSIYINFYSYNSYNSNREQLEVSPNIIMSDDSYSVAHQSIYTQNLKSDNTLGTEFETRFFNFGIKTNLNYNMATIESKLKEADNMKNDVAYNNIVFKVLPSISYRPYSYFTATVSAPITRDYLNIDNRISSSSNSEAIVLFNPTLRIRWEPSYSFKVVFNSGYLDFLSNPEKMHEGYIMTNYRTLISTGNAIIHTKGHLHNLDITYANAPNALFCSVKGEYYNAKSDKTNGTVYDGILSQIITYDIPSTRESFSFDASVSKRFSSFSTSVKLMGGGVTSNAICIIQEKQTQLFPENFFTALQVDSRPFNFLLISYFCKYIESRTRILDSETPTIKSIRQDLKMDCYIGKKTVVRLGGHHYWNNTVTERRGNMFFLDASICYKTGRMEYILEGTNLLNTKWYGTSSYRSNSSYYYLYSLRPLSVMLKVHFSLR